MNSVFINAVETAVPQHQMHGKFVSYVSSKVDGSQKSVFRRLATKCQIESRYSVLKPSDAEAELDNEGFYIQSSFPSTMKRMKLYEREALPLASRALEKIFGKFKPELISHVIITSCTGFYAPGLDLEIVDKYKLATSTERSIIGFMGCYAAVNGLKAAYHIVRSQPHARVLMLTMELCTLHLQETYDWESLLSYLQFADGCSASVISAEESPLEIESFRCLLSPENRDLIQWRVGDSGFNMRLSLDVPKALEAALKRNREELNRDASIFAIHPGGRSILDAVQNSFGLEESQLNDSREVLRQYGNMSSSTIMFVLERILKDSSKSGKGLGMAFGPGLSLETFRFNKRWM